MEGITGGGGQAGKVSDQTNERTTGGRNSEGRWGGPTGWPFVCLVIFFHWLLRNKRISWWWIAN